MLPLASYTAVPVLAPSAVDPVEVPPEPPPEEDAPPLEELFTAPDPVAAVDCCAPPVPLVH